MARIDRSTAKTETWRDGVETTVLVSAETGAKSLCIFEQRVAPGHGAPLHTHTVEEVLEVNEGSAAVKIDGTVTNLTCGQMIVVPAHAAHGFVNTGQGDLYVRATLAAPHFEASYVDTSSSVVRWKSDGKGSGA